MCRLADRLSERLGLEADVRGDAYWAALLHSSGCTADAYEAALLYGDDISTRAAWSVVDGGRPLEVVRFLRGRVGTGPRLVAALVAGPGRARQGFAAHCEVAGRLARQLGLGEGVSAALEAAFERWDGKGYPAGRRGEDLPLAARVLHVARDAEVFRALGGASVVGRRAGRAYDPDVVAALDGLELSMDGSDWDAVVAAEPLPRAGLTGAALDEACRAVAEFVDVKSPWTLGHSTGVADLAEAAGWRMGLVEAKDGRLRRAGLLHDLGRVAVSNGVWDREGPLGDDDWEAVRLHPYHTDRVLSRCLALQDERAIAASHHERADGRGYHRGVPASVLGPAERVLAAADAFHAMTEPRPHRPALGAEEAAAVLRTGAFDREAADAVCAAAGQRAAQRAAQPGGLTEREVEVLRLIARGLSNKQVAARLGISPKTVGHHVEHVYAKAGVSTRAGAALFAVERGLL